MLRRPSTTPSPSRFNFRLAAAAAASALLAACGGGFGPDPGNPPPGALTCVELPQEVTWLRSTTASAAWHDVLLDPRNRIWLAGWTDGTVGVERTDPGGNSRAVVRQLSPTGTQLWDSGALLETSGTDVAEALTLTAAGTLHVAGRATVSLGGAVPAGQADTFVAWSDQPGTATGTWRTFQTGTDRPQRPRRVMVANNGDVVVAGYDDVHVPGNHVVAWSDPFALRLQRQGAGTASDRLSLRWQHQFGTEAADTVDALATDTAGATFVAGQVATGSGQGMFLRKLDGAGQTVWTVPYSSIGLDNVAALVPMIDGSVLMAGTVSGSFRGGVSAGQQDVFVARISPVDGRVLASAQYGSSGSEWVTDVKVDTRGNIVVLGETDGAMVAGQPNAGASDLFLLRIAPTGSGIGRRQWGTAGDEMAARLAVDSCGRVVAVGSSTTAGTRAGVLWYWKP